MWYLGHDERSSNLKPSVFYSLIDEVATLNVHTVCHIPRSFCSLFAKVLSTEFNSACSRDLWGHAVFPFAKAVLCSPLVAARKRVCRQLDLLSCLLEWQTGDLLSLWKAARSDARSYTEVCIESLCLKQILDEVYFMLKKTNSASLSNV